MLFIFIFKPKVNSLSRLIYLKKYIYIFYLGPKTYFSFKLKYASLYRCSNTDVLRLSPSTSVNLIKPVLSYTYSWGLS